MRCLVMKDKTFIELCEEADIIKCYGYPAFFLNDTLYFYDKTLDCESRQKIKINRDKQPKRTSKYQSLPGKAAGVPCPGLFSLCCGGACHGAAAHRKPPHPQGSQPDPGV